MLKNISEEQLNKYLDFVLLIENLGFRKIEFDCGTPYACEENFFTVHSKFNFPDLKYLLSNDLKNYFIDGNIINSFYLDFGFFKDEDSILKCTLYFAKDRKLSEKSSMRDNYIVLTGDKISDIDFMYHIFSTYELNIFKKVINHFLTSYKNDRGKINQ